MSSGVESCVVLTLASSETNYKSPFVKKKKYICMFFYNFKLNKFVSCIVLSNSKSSTQRFHQHKTISTERQAIEVESLFSKLSVKHNPPTGNAYHCSWPEHAWRNSNIIAGSH